MRSNILKWSRGVTLVELMVVVALIAIIAAIASPGISRGIERANARSAAREVASLLREARSQAMSRGVPIWISVTPVAGTNRGRIEIIRATNNPAIRSCRQVGIATFQIVGERDMNALSGSVGIRGVEPAAQNTVTVGALNLPLHLCFSPDGRAMTSNGRLLSSINVGAPAERCAGEDGLIWLSRIDDAPDATHLECATAADRAAQRDERDVIQFFKVSVPYNGNIRVEQ